MERREYFEQDIHVRDSVVGTVIGSCRTGLFLELENGRQAFATFASLPKGTKVLCCIIRIKSKNQKSFVAIDSILQEASEAA